MRSILVARNSGMLFHTGTAHSKIGLTNLGLQVFKRIKKSDPNSRTIGIVLYCYFLSFLSWQKRSTWDNNFFARQISTLPIASFRWDLNFRRDRSKEQFHLRGWVGVLVDWRDGRRSSEGWGKCRTDEIWDEQTRTVLFILRFAYWLQILRKHTSFFYDKHRSNNYNEL